VRVTFAGSPDRAEAQLVPEAGYEFDPFRVAGFPREPSLALLRALALAGRAPLACREILARRRPHVVLGGGGYVAGPMVLAAWTRRIPAAVTEAGGVRGVPVFITRSLFPALMIQEGDVGGAQYLRGHPEAVEAVHFDDPDLVRDVDRPEDYTRLLELDPDAEFA